MAPNTICCHIRKEWVIATPEEIVRQNLLEFLTGPLGFPSSQIAVEKGLRQMPHLALIDQELPDRRADIICFGANIHPKHSLFPLLLIECKAVKITPKMINQVVGYNHFMKAYFICVANSEDIRFGWVQKNKLNKLAYEFIPRIPTYQEICTSLKQLTKTRDPLLQPPIPLQQNTR